MGKRSKLSCSQAWKIFVPRAPINFGWITGDQIRSCSPSEATSSHFCGVRPLISRHAIEWSLDTYCSSIQGTSDEYIQFAGIAPTDCIDGPVQSQFYSLESGWMNWRIRPSPTALEIRRENPKDIELPQSFLTFLLDFNNYIFLHVKQIACSWSRHLHYFVNISKRIEAHDKFRWKSHLGPRSYPHCQILKVDSHDLSLDLKKIKISENIIPESRYFQISSALHIGSTSKGAKNNLTIFDASLGWTLQSWESKTWKHRINIWCPN